MKRLRQLEDENAKLKRIVADPSLDKAMLQDVLSKKLGGLPASASLSTRSGGLDQPRRAGRTEAEKQGRLPNTGALRLPPRARAAQA